MNLQTIYRIKNIIVTAHTSIIGVRTPMLRKRRTKSSALIPHAKSWLIKIISQQVCSVNSKPKEAFATTVKTHTNPFLTNIGFVNFSRTLQQLLSSVYASISVQIKYHYILRWKVEDIKEVILQRAFKMHPCIVNEYVYLCIFGTTTTQSVQSSLFGNAVQ